MVQNDNLRYTKMALNNGSGAIPALGFGTLIPDPMATRTATKAALEAGFRQLDASERYRNEKEVGEAMQEVFKAGRVASCCKLSRRWGTAANPTCWKSLLSPQSPNESTRPRRKSCSPGRSSAARPS